MLNDLPECLFGLWPKLKSALGLLERGNQASAIVFESEDEQGMEACKLLATSLGWHTEELPASTFTKSDFQKQIGRYIEPEAQSDLFEPSPDCITIILPNLDERGEWVHLNLKSMLERPQAQFVLLATAADESRIPTYLHGHYFTCRKKGAAMRSKKHEVEP